jgi:hypothetical protein
MEAPMTITPELKQAVAQAGDDPVRVEDPETHAAYVVLKEEVYRKRPTKPILDCADAPIECRPAKAIVWSDDEGYRARPDGRIFANSRGHRRVGLRQAPAEGFGMRIVTEEDLAAIRSPAPSTEGIAPDGHSDPQAGPALRTFLVLTQSRRALIERGWTPEDIFYSRYYWFRRFVNLRVASTGPDAGLEQQAHQILEHPDCDPDWSAVERVESPAAGPRVPRDFRDGIVE